MPSNRSAGRTTPRLDALRARADVMVEQLATLVSTETPSEDLTACDNGARVLSALAQDVIGDPGEVIEVDGRQHLHWRWPATGGSPSIALIGHFDTVWPMGTLARWPFSVDTANGTATGPGCFDMKTGIIQLLHAIATLDDRSGLEILLTSDEEIGSGSSQALIEEIARRSTAALILEPASTPTTVKVGRKGTSWYRIDVHGRAAHAGLEPEKGANALVELAHLVLALDGIARPGIGTTVTPTLAAAGTAGNVVPAAAALTIDVRVAEPDEAGRVDRDIHALAATVPGTSLTVVGGPNRPPLPPSSGAALFAHASALAEKLGWVHSRASPSAAARTATSPRPPAARHSTDSARSARARTPKASGSRPPRCPNAPRSWRTSSMPFASPADYRREPKRRRAKTTRCSANSSKPLHRRTAMAFRTRAVAAISVLAVALLGSVVPTVTARADVTTVPRPDHVVVLVLENHSVTNILANPDAPYINSLATSGANMTQSFAETHPSQPNYIALFAGSPNGVTDDSCPRTFTTDNLGAQALAAGIGFTGYSEGLPSVGYTGCTSGRYARKHTPWVNFSNVPAASNQPLTSFPTDYSTLPAISFVIPNLDHDMHDGTIAQGDTWIRDNLDGYVQWAKTHNSVLVLTFDEDDNTPANQIPTVIVGERVLPGQYSEHINHYNILRTIQDGFGLAPLGNSATAAPILDIWTPDTDAPQAVFTVSCVDLTCSADGSASSATTGALTAWDWTWGDGAATSGPTSSHTYASPGDFTVTLRVTDDSGRAAQTTHPASPRAPGGGTVFASDGFGRTSSSGFGLADIGGPWAVAGSATNYTVAGEAGRIRIVAGSGPNAYLGSLSSTDTDLTADVSLDKVGNSGTTQVALVGRGTSSNAYRGKIGISPTGGVTAYLTKVVAGAESTVVQAAVTGLTYTAGTTLRLRLQVVGSSPTSLKFKVWKGSDAEPSAWRLSTTGSTAAVQTAGGIGLWSYTSGAVTNAPLTLSVDNLSARPTSTTPPANVPPVARFTSTTADLTASLNGSTSSDSDGTISSYSWDYGDNTALGTGATPNHTYTTAAAYQVTLTVTVTAPAGGSTFATDTFGRTSSSGFGTADTGGAWTVAGTATNYTVAGGVGKIRIATAGSGPNAYLNSVSSTGTDLSADVALDKIGNGGTTQVALVGRGNASNAYRGKIVISSTGAVTAYLTKVVAGAETTLIQTSVTGMTYVAGDTLHLRMQAVGSGTASLKFKVWKGSDAEPSAWRLSTTDSTAAVQSAGGIGLWTYLSSAATNAPVTISVDNVAAQHTN